MLANHFETAFTREGSLPQTFPQIRTDVAKIEYVQITCSDVRRVLKSLKKRQIPEPGWSSTNLFERSGATDQLSPYDFFKEEPVTRFVDEGHTVEEVYFDFPKTFDSVNHRFLLAKMKYSGKDGAVLNWMKFYLSNRSQQARIDGVLSEEAPCLSGVPRSSVIGQLLFQSYINDPPNAPGDSAQISLTHFVIFKEYAWQVA